MMSYGTIRRIVATATLGMFLVLFAIVSNVVQPTWDFGLHCSVHDYVAASLGGECDSETGSLFSAINSLFVTFAVLTMSFFAISFVMRCVLLISSALALSNELADASPPHKIFLYYSAGIALSRRFA